jgi:hypothetical protein
MIWSTGNSTGTRSGFSTRTNATRSRFAYESIRDDGNTNARDWKIGARLSFRTLGGIGTGDVESPLLKPSF